jgi:hypothetical protein
MVTAGTSVNVETSSMVRLLTLRGLAQGEAVNLAAFLCGIPVAGQHWGLREINHLLFLRELHRRGQFGPGDGTPRQAIGPTVREGV